MLLDEYGEPVLGLVAVLARSEAEPSCSPRDGSMATNAASISPADRRGTSRDTLERARTKRR